MYICIYIIIIMLMWSYKYMYSSLLIPVVHNVMHSRFKSHVLKILIQNNTVIEICIEITWQKPLIIRQNHKGKKVAHGLDFILKVICKK